MEQTELSHLCSVCESLLYSETPFAGEPEPVDTIIPHHRSFESFRQAVLERCYICSIFAYNLDREQPELVQSQVDNATLMFLGHVRVEDIYSQNPMIKVSMQCSDARTLKTFVQARFRIMPFTEPLVQTMMPTLQFDSSTSADSVLGQARNWYQTCCDNHSQCNTDPFRETRNFMPTRVIQVSDSSTWRLVDPMEDALEGRKYMTLSYRWGEQDQKLKLLRANIDQFRRGMPIATLPQTFKDFLVVARQFGVEYIWIDALCIIQDSKEDWLAEAPKMCYVYSYSAVNIMASASSSPEGGLFRERDVSSVGFSPGIIRKPAQGTWQGRYTIFDKSFWERRILSGPVHRRGWVFQERLLAPRALYFTADQVMWECRAACVCEALPNGIPFHEPLKDLDALWPACASPTQPEANQASEKPSRSDDPNNLAILNTWNKLVKDYSRCSLTVKTDKAIAFAGIAKLFQELTGDEYVAGLWKSSILAGLDWRVEERRASTPNTEQNAPSWSWLSVEGPVRPRGLTASTEFLISMEEKDMEQAGLPPAREVSAAELVVKGCLMSGRIKEHDPDVLSAKVSMPGGYEIWCRMLLDGLPAGILYGDTVDFLPFKSDRTQGHSTLSDALVCLILERSLVGGRGVYRRKGVLLPIEFLASGDGPSRERAMAFEEFVKLLEYKAEVVLI